MKPGRDQEFLHAHRTFEANWTGLKKVNMIKTGDQTYCIIVEWADMADLAAARPDIIANLNSFRDTLEVLDGDLGVNDPVSGSVVSRTEVATTLIDVDRITHWPRWFLEMNWSA